MARTKSKTSPDICVLGEKSCWIGLSFAQRLSFSSWQRDVFVLVNLIDSMLQNREYEL